MAQQALGVRFTAASAGTGSFVNATTVTGYAGTATLVDGATYRYRAESLDLSQWEWGTGVWNASTSTLTRTPSLSSNANSVVSFTATPQVAFVIFPADVLQFDIAMSLTAAQRAQARSNISAALKGQLYGLTLSTAGSTGTFGIAAGEAADSTGVDLMVLASAYTKTTGSWAVGSGNGALDTGTIAVGNWYHVFLIKRPDTGVVDLLVSLNATAPTLPTNYTLFRRIGSMITDGSAHWKLFHQLGDEFLMDASGQDVTTITTSITPSSPVLSVPSSVQVTANIILRLDYVSAALSIFASPLDISDQAAGGSFSHARVDASTLTEFASLLIRTNLSSQIRIRASAAAGTYSILTLGWIDNRGRLG